mgnify:CR=1 FL=1
MPKQEHRILEFHGGTNNKFDPRDIAENQNALSRFSIRRPGRLVCEGDAKTLYSQTGLNGHTITNISASSGGFEDGFGLHAFSHDFDMDATPEEVDTDYVVLNDMNEIDIYDPNKSGGAGWRAAQFTLGSRTSNVKPEYYNVDGGLRVCDSNFEAADTAIRLASQEIMPNATPDTDLTAWTCLDASGADANGWNADGPSEYQDGKTSSLIATLPAPEPGTAGQIRPGETYSLTFTVGSNDLSLRISGDDDNTTVTQDEYFNVLKDGVESSAARIYAASTAHTVTFTPSLGHTHLYFTADTNSGGASTITSISLKKVNAIDKSDTVIFLDDGSGNNPSMPDGSIIKIDEEIMYVAHGTSSTSTAMKVIRGFANTKVTTHADNAIVDNVNIPKYFGHIKKSRFFEAKYSDPVNVWIEDCQTPEPPNDNKAGVPIEASSTYSQALPYVAAGEARALTVYDNINPSTDNFPYEGEKVVLEFTEKDATLGIQSVSVSDGRATFTTSGKGASATAGHGLANGQTIVISNMISGFEELNGTYEDITTTSNTFTVTVPDGFTKSHADNAIYYANAGGYSDLDGSSNPSFADSLQINVNDSLIPFLDDDYAGSDSDNFPAHATYGGQAYVHITNQEGILGINGIHLADRIDDNSLRIKTGEHSNASSATGTTQVRQLIGLVSREGAGDSINDELKRKWIFGMSFTYDGPSDEVQESLISPSYYFTQAFQADGITSNNLTGDEDSGTVYINVDDSSVFNVGDIISIKSATTGTKEEMLVRKVKSNVLTVDRGYRGTTRSEYLDNEPLFKLNEMSVTNPIDFTSFNGVPNATIKFLHKHASDGNALGDERIHSAAHREFSSDATQWVAHDPSGGSVSVDSDGGGGTAYMKITGLGTNASNEEGAKLNGGSITSPQPFKKYRISADMWYEGGSVPATGNVFYFEFGGGVSDAFDVGVNAAGTTFTKDVIAQNHDGTFKIYKKSTNSTQFNVDNISVKEVVSGTWNPRINGFKIYMKDVTNEQSSDVWKLFSRVNFDKGTYQMFAASEAEIILEQPGNWQNDYKVSTFLDKDTLDGTDLTMQPFETYTSENLFSPDTIIDAQYKHAELVGRRVYIGNVKQGGISYPDRVIKSLVNKFDVFPETNFIDVAVGDGDEITALSSFGDRLLQFKRDKLYIINISGETEVLESEHPNAGIAKPHQTVKTSNGIAWINAIGLWFFDGQQVRCLTRHLELDGYVDDFGVTALIGFDEKSNRLIYTPKKVVGLNTVWYIYDLELNAYQSHYLGNLFPTATSDGGTQFYSNFINIHRSMVFAFSTATDNTEVNFYNWSNTSAGGGDTAVGNTSLWESKDYDFGSPATNKKIYKIYVTYKSTGHSGVKMVYSTNGNATLDSTFSNSTNYNTAVGKGFLNTSGEWAVAELKPSSSINNVKSIQLAFKANPVATSASSCASTGNTTTIQLASALGSTDYSNYILSIYDGPARYNVRRIQAGGGDGIAYNTSNQTATVNTLTDNGYSNSVTTDSKYILGAVAPDFEINDITIIYRPKRVK